VTPALIRELYAYDRWANGKLLDVVSAMPAGDATRELGAQWSFPTLKGMFAHILAAEIVWFARFGGDSPTRLLGDADFPDLPALRAAFAKTEAEIQAFVDAVEPADLTRVVTYKNTRGDAFNLPLGPLLQHVANHSTHHRSEAASMITMLQGSPPATDLVFYHLMASGQMKP
jgi:uncharacterized damage-inducible protein DinB